MPTVIGVLLRVTEQHRANTHPYLQANLLASIMGENPIGKTNKLGEQDFSSTERRIFFFIVPFFKRFIIYFFNFYDNVVNSEFLYRPFVVSLSIVTKWWTAGWTLAPSIHLFGSGVNPSKKNFVYTAHARNIRVSIIMGYIVFLTHY